LDRVEEIWLRDGKGGGAAADRAKMRSIFCEGPSRPASPDTARPAQRAGQPQKIKMIGRLKKFVELLAFKSAYLRIKF